MKNHVRQVLLSCNEYNKQNALRIVEVIERLSAVELEHLVIRHLYKDASLPYDYIKERGTLSIARIEKSLSILYGLPDSKKVIQWLLNYCSAQNDFRQIKFDSIPMDQFLSFAEIFNSSLYNDINALLSFNDELHSQVFIQCNYGRPSINTRIHPLGDIDNTIKTLQQDGIVLEVYRKSRGLATNITYITPEKTVVCHANLSNLVERNPDWFTQSITIKKSDEYESLVAQYPIEIKAFEEILTGKRPYYIRTDEPDYTTPPLKTYEFTETTYCHLSELGQNIYRELKKELAQKVKTNYKTERTGMHKIDMETLMHITNHNSTLEAMYKREVVCTAKNISDIKIFPDCIVLMCENVVVKSTGGRTPNEQCVSNIPIEIAPHVNLNIFNLIHYQRIVLYGIVEYQTDDGDERLGILASDFSLLV